MESRSNRRKIPQIQGTSTYRLDRAPQNNALSEVSTFLAATETVLEPGDMLSVVAPATPDATLAEVGFTLA